MQDDQDAETSRDKVQTEKNRIKKTPTGDMDVFSCVFVCVVAI
jgi:hypothetical protein